MFTKNALPIYFIYSVLYVVILYKIPSERAFYF